MTESIYFPAIVEALKNLHIAYNNKYSSRKKDQVNMSDLYGNKLVLIFS